jgi:hypothetical protein
MGLALTDVAAEHADPVRDRPTDGPSSSTCRCWLQAVVTRCFECLEMKWPRDDSIKVSRLRFLAQKSDFGAVSKLATQLKARRLQPNAYADALAILWSIVVYVISNFALTLSRLTRLILVFSAEFEVCILEHIVRTEKCL